MKKILLLLLATVYSSCALAADWKCINRNNDVYVFIEVSSIKKPSESTRVVWEEYVSSDASMKNNIKTSIKKTEYYCKDGTSQLLASVNYSRDKSVASSTTTKGEIEDIIPGSFGEATLNYVCNGKKPPLFVSVPDDPTDAANRAFASSFQP